MTTSGWRWVTSPAVRPQGRPEVVAVLPELLIGEYPTPPDAEWLHGAHGVTAVVSLQDEADLASKGLVLAEVESAYRTSGIHFEHVPIADCDLPALRRGLDGLVNLLGRLIDAERARVYLHCNAGLNRAPTVAIAYLHARRGLSLGAARDLVRSRRHCAPYMSVLEAHYGFSR
jgi:protein-tyrosine phosphatase